MFTVGSHLSSSKGYLAMGKTAREMGANTFQFFTRNPRGGGVKKMDIEDAGALMDFARENHFGPIVAHAPYTLNICSAEPKTREFADSVLREDLARMEFLPGNYYNFHPGSHTGQGAANGIAVIADQLNRVLRPEQKTIVLLETMAGKGTEVGRSFEELHEILNRIACGDRMGVCLDTCHVWDAGYDIRDHLDDVLEKFDRVVGLRKLRAVHLNDSKNPLGSRKDRHERIGEGVLGLETFARLITHPALENLPFILETPCDTEGHAKEILLLRSFL